MTQRTRLTVVGGGPGGCAAAFAAAEAGMDVTLVERRALGGTCLHTGCIPTKTLRASADALETASRAAAFGLSGTCSLQADMPAVLARKAKVVSLLQGGLEKTAARLGVRVVRGTARILDAGLTVAETPDGTTEIPGDRTILAVGSSPLVLPELPVDHRTVLSSDDALELQAVPEHLLVVGGGVIGCELAFIYRAFGAGVTVVEGRERLLPLPGVDGEISRLLLREMKKRGINVELGRTVARTMPDGNGVRATVTASPFIGDSVSVQPREVQTSAVCVTVGRIPCTDGLGLAEAGIQVDERGWIAVDDTLETSVPGIYAVGDVIGPARIMLAHMAQAEAHTAVHNILHPETPRRQRYDAVPSAMFTTPEIGVVGLSEEEARNQCLNVRCTLLQFRELGKAQAMGELAGLFKLVAEADGGRLLGAHVAGAHASDLIAEATLALNKGCTVAELRETIHAHPTLAEGFYEAAGLWS